MFTKSKIKICYIIVVYRLNCAVSWLCTFPIRIFIFFARASSLISKRFAHRAQSLRKNHWFNRKLQLNLNSKFEITRLLQKSSAYINPELINDYWHKFCLINKHCVDAAGKIISHLQYKHHGMRLIFNISNGDINIQSESCISMHTLNAASFSGLRSAMQTWNWEGVRWVHER